MDEMMHELLERWERTANNAMGSDYPKEEYFLKLTRETFNLFPSWKDIRMRLSRNTPR